MTPMVCIKLEYFKPPLFRGGGNKRRMDDNDWWKLCEPWMHNATGTYNNQPHSNEPHATRELLQFIQSTRLAQYDKYAKKRHHGCVWLKCPRHPQCSLACYFDDQMNNFFHYSAL